MKKRRALLGALAGGLGGAIGAAEKLICEKIVPPRPPGREPPPGILVANLVRAIDGTELTKDERKRISNVIHWTFSIVTSAAYGALAETWPAATAGNGVAFGIAVWAGFHEITLPLLGATPPLAELPISEQVNEFVTHALFGATVEFVRANVRA